MTAAEHRPHMRCKRTIARSPIRVLATESVGLLAPHAAQLRRKVLAAVRTAAQRELDKRRPFGDQAATNMVGIAREEAQGRDDFRVSAVALHILTDSFEDGLLSFEATDTVTGLCVPELVPHMGTLSRQGSRALPFA